MKKTLFTSVLLGACLFARVTATIENPNDIMIVGASDWPSQKNFLFVNFAPIDINEEIQFTNGIWNGTGFDIGSTFTFQNTTGSVIEVGTVTEASANALPSLEFFSADQIFAYTGTASSPNLVFGFQSADWGSATNGASDLPSGLTDGVTALDLTFNGPSEDHAVYTGSRSFGSVAEAQNAILDLSNWTVGDNGTSYDINPILVPEPASLVMALILGGLFVVSRRRAG